MIKRQKYNYFVYKYMFLIENLTVEGGSKAKFNTIHECYKSPKGTHRRYYFIIKI